MAIKLGHCLLNERLRNGFVLFGKACGQGVTARITVFVARIALDMVVTVDINIDRIVVVRGVPGETPLHIIAVVPNIL